MKNIFAGSPWSTPQQGGVQGRGFRPGPVQVIVVGGGPGHFQLGGAQRPLPFKSASEPQPQMEGECADGSCSTHQQPSQLPIGRVPMGKKTDCPVCRSFGGGKSGF